MRFHRGLFAGLVVLALAAAPMLAPTVADARAGDGGSFGSRGSMTYSAPPRTNTTPYGAAPVQRSMTPNYQPSPGYGGSAPYYQQQRSPFMSGLMGGLIGAGIGGLLFGHGFLGGGMGVFGFIGLLIQIFIIVAIGRFLWRLFTGNRSPLTASGPNIFARNGAPGARPPGGVGGLMGGGARPGAPPIQITPADYGQFEQLLKGVQAAWTAHDMNGLQAMATPEMVSYFGEQLSEQVSRGVRNEVSDVRLLQGDLSQAWAEGGREYATVAMRFSMIDVTRDNAGRIVDGSPAEHVTATEYWTFVRSRGGQWILSAIQQSR